MIHILSFVLSLYNEAEHIDLDSTTADRQLNNTTIRKLAREKKQLNAYNPNTKFQFA